MSKVTKIKRTKNALIIFSKEEIRKKTYQTRYVFFVPITIMHLSVKGDEIELGYWGINMKKKIFIIGIIYVLLFFEYLIIKKVYNKVLISNTNNELYD